jgi:TolB-like protein/tetratricopeptide (TPR) repeat protein
MSRRILFGEWCFDPDALVVTDGRMRVVLEPRVARLLEVFLAHPGEVLSHDSLVDSVWDGRPVSDEAVRRAVSALRHAIPCSNPAGFIRTVHKKGYIGRFPRAPGAGKRSTDVLPASDDVAGVDTTPPPPARAASRLPRNAGSGILLLVVLVALAGVLWNALHVGGRSPVQPPADVPHTLAVLPFANLSDDAGMAFFSDGMAEELLAVLSRNRAFQVIARGSSFRFRDPERDVREIGELLGVRYLIEGSVRREDDRVRITAALLDTGTGFQLWSEGYDVGTSDVLAVHADIAGKVAAALQTVLSTDVPLPSSDAAHVEYLKARHLMTTWVTDDLELAMGHLHGAIALDPGYAAAHAALADVIVMLSNDIPEDEQRAARATATLLLDRALELDPALGEAHITRGWLLESPTDVEAALRRALELSPSSARGHELLAENLFWKQGRRDEGLAMIDRARTLDPLRARGHYLKALMFAFAGDFDACEQLLQHVLRVDPRFRSALVRLATLQASRGRYAQAIDLAERALAIDPRSPWIRARLLSFYAMIEDTSALDSLREPALWETETTIAVSRSDWQHAAAAIDDAAGEIANPDALHGAWLGVTLLAHALENHAALASHRLAATRYGGTLAPWQQNENPWAVEASLYFALLQHLAGATPDARSEIDAIEQHLVALSLRHPGFAPMTQCARALSATILDEADRALDLLETPVASEHGRCLWLIRSHPAFRTLHGQPRFMAFRARADAHLAIQQAELAKLRRDGRVPDRGT